MSESLMMPTPAKARVLATVHAHPGIPSESFQTQWASFTACDRRGWLGLARDGYAVRLTADGAVAYRSYTTQEATQVRDH